jgi:thiamine-phosphate pyrophosphorylase
VSWERIADVNVNRLDESLKFIEDIVRFNLEHKTLLRKIRMLRGAFLRIKKTLADDRTITFRNSRHDPGRSPDFDVRERRTERDLVLANLTRAKESARTLEEIMKQENIALSKRFKRIRFGIYDIETTIVDLLHRQFDPRMHIILDEQYLARKDIVALVRMLEAHGATMFQLRVRTLPDRTFYRYGIAVKRALKKKRTKFIINDRLDIVLACRADGVHLGQDDVPVHVARRILGSSMIIGASARTVAQARAAERQGADYIGVGSLYPTTTKTDARITGLGMLKAICKQVTVPVIGVGGITNDNYENVLRAGAAGIAVASYVLKGNARRAIRSLTEK